MSHFHTELGLGLIGIGKPWGHVPRPVPTDAEAQSLLEFAWQLGVRYFDTAPSYGPRLSEQRLGRFVNSLDAEQRRGIVIATKLGEHWDRAKGEPYADHSYEALRRSLDESIEALGRIDILQLHKTTPQVLRSDAVARIFEEARNLGARVGPSVSDLESANIAVRDPGYSFIQLPYNRENAAFAPVIAAARHMHVAVNRPFAMGAMIHSGADKRDAFRFVLDAGFNGVVLTGTTNRDHLRENWEAFQQALANPKPTPNLPSAPPGMPPDPAS